MAVLLGRIRRRLGGLLRWGRLSGSRLTGSRLGRGRLGSHGREDLPSKEQKLGRIELLGPGAVALTEELFELVLELGDEMLLGVHRLGELADQLMGGGQVVRQLVGCDRHTISTYRPLGRDK